VTKNVLEHQKSVIKTTARPSQHMSTMTPPGKYLDDRPSTTSARQFHNIHRHMRIPDTWIDIAGCLLRVTKSQWSN